MKRILLAALAALALSCAAMAQNGGYSSPVVGAGGPSASGIPYGTGTGTAQAQAVTTTPNITSLVTGTYVTWLPVAANTAAAPTLAAGTTAATPITKCGTVALVAGDLLSTIWAVAQYDGTEWVLQNPVQAGCDGGLPTAGGSANALTLTVSPALTAYAAGQTWNLLPLAANTSAATIAISGLSTRNITKCGTTALVANDMTTTAIAVLLDDGTELQLLNPQAVPCGPAVVLNGANVGTAAMTLDRSASTTATGDRIPNIAGANPSTTNGACDYDTTAEEYVCGDSVLGKLNKARTATSQLGSSDTLSCNSVSNGVEQVFATTYAIPQNSLLQGRTLTVQALFTMTTSSSPPNFSGTARFGDGTTGGTLIWSTSAAAAPAASMTNIPELITFVMTAQAAPSASSNVVSGALGSTGGGGFFANRPGTGQPVALATNASGKKLTFGNVCSVNTAANSITLVSITEIWN